MKCIGRDAISGETIEVEFDRVINYVDPVLDESSIRPGTFLCAGFIDLQVNGFAGVDFNLPSTSVSQMEAAHLAIASTGVTRYFPTVITASEPHIIACLRNLARFEAFEAFHVEGPHISAEDGPRGAHPREWVRPPDHEEFLRWQDAADGRVRMVTLAPEWPGACSYIEQLAGAGIVVAIGHTRASAAQIHDAVAAGATLSTHLGNGAGSKDRKDEFIEQQLSENRLSASFIVDGHHLPAEFLRAAFARKGVERSVLVTDAVAPAMSEPGPYQLGEVAVELRADGRVTLRGEDRLAGSSLTMDQAVSNAMREAGVSLAEAVVMATSNAARAGRIGNRWRGLKPGERADITQFHLAGGRVAIDATYISGQKVFESSASVQ